MARTCFPSEDLNGGNGHTPADVTCKYYKQLCPHSIRCHATLLNVLFIDIIFTGDDAVLPDSAIGNNYLTDFATLTSMGNSFMADLVDELGL